ncbi:MAG: bifunctional pyr operon transcriptional regulator/uracil phosphoribosyltransferase PyrR [Eubacteriales bacterium]|nr:bifunctional pyr operon transcriptional regulator/uracil phosphoribosyltransferase PyrR [Eubacteriales bacterium]
MSERVAKVLEQSSMERTIRRLAHEVIERNEKAQTIVLIGIKRRGATLAKRLAKEITSLSQKSVDLAFVDISFYRDDLSYLAADPILNAVEIAFAIEGRDIVLVDDVLYTGRTARAAIDAIFDQGRPASIRLAVLIDRGHRELPIRADFVGKNIPTAKNQHVKVEFLEDDGIEQVTVYTQAEKAAYNSSVKGGNEDELLAEKCKAL